MEKIVKNHELKSSHFQDSMKMWHSQVQWTFIYRINLVFRLATYLKSGMVWLSSVIQKPDKYVRVFNVYYPFSILYLIRFSKG
jgi:hypothetical protein